MENKFNILYNAFIIIYLIENDLLLFINDYKIALIKELIKTNKENPIFILTFNENDLKQFCIKLINKLIGC